MPRILFLSGGTGTPKLLQGAIRVLSLQDIAIIGNTGDDWNFYGLHVSPDIDSVLLTLSDLIDTAKWWGIDGDSFNLIEFLRTHLHEDVWFNLGDFDAGLCLYRTHLLKQGNNLTQATDIIRKRLKIKASILPMADQQIQTQIKTPSGTMHLQEFWVKHRGNIEVQDVYFDGDLSITTSAVTEAIKKAEIVVFGPSNPVSSLGPILAIHPLREALRKTTAFRLAISPIIGEHPVSGPTSAFLKAWNIPTSPMAIISLFGHVLDGYMIHTSDERFSERILHQNITPILDNILIHSSADAERLMQRILDFR
ncbi:MAG: 2-phospho-L-lactate transferase [Candidatus Heimdallarchaeota archaeon]